MIVLLLPSADYDPTEAAVPWAALHAAGLPVRFATPDGTPAFADERLVSRGFGPASPLLMTGRAGLDAYGAMTADPAFGSPVAYADVDPAAVRGLVVPGGHAQGMRTMLESPLAQKLAAGVFTAGRPVGGICHGVLLLARATDPATGRSVLYGRKTTALPATMELSAWALTRPWLGSYYRTYPQTVQAEVTAALASPRDFLPGPRLSRRDSPDKPERGFTVRDGTYLSARWPGDAHRFATELLSLLTATTPDAVHDS